MLLRYTTETIVGFQLDFPAGYVLPDCAPDCLITLSCGEASLHPTQQGYSISRRFNPPINPDGIYDLTLFVSTPFRHLLSLCPS